ncbi:MAG: response regulator transcription factor [Bacteroidia bacterium]|nr:response regulator transcription factor [Bacteroidia bacterium]
MIRIAIVDDKEQNRVSLAEKLTFKKEFEIVFLAANGQDFLDKMNHAKKVNQPQVVLMDIDMPVMNGIEAVNHGSRVYMNTKFLMLTVFDDDDKIFDAIKAGAIGYLLKDEKVERISDAIKETIDSGGAPMSPRIARKALKLLMQSNVEFKKEDVEVTTRLTDREREILKYIVDGHDYRAIGEKLFISPNTVRTHITNIYEKLHVCNKAQAINVAIKNKWFTG